MLAVIFFLSKNLSDKKRDMEVDLWENNPEVILSLMMGFSWGVFIYSNSYRVIFCLSILSDLCYIKNIFWQDVNPCRWLRMVLSYQSNSSFKKKKNCLFLLFPQSICFCLTNTSCLRITYSIPTLSYPLYLPVGSQFE